MTHFDLDNFLPYTMTLATHKLVTSVFEVYSQYDIDIGQWRILVYLGNHQKTIPAQEIRMASQLDAVKFTRACTALDKKGWIRKQTHPHDQRQRNLALTAKGKKAYAMIIKDVSAWYENLNADIGTETIETLLHHSKDLTKKL